MAIVSLLRLGAKVVGKKLAKSAKNMMSPTIQGMKKLASKKSTGISFKPKGLMTKNTGQKYDKLYKSSKYRNKAADAYNKATPSWTDKAYGAKTKTQRAARTNFIQTESKILNESNRIMSGQRKVVRGKKKYVAGESGAIDGSSFKLGGVSSNRGMYNPRTKSRHPKMGAHGDKIPNDLMTRPKAGSRGTLRAKPGDLYQTVPKTKSQRAASAIKNQDLINKAGALNPKSTKYAKPQMGGKQKANAWKKHNQQMKVFNETGQLPKGYKLDKNDPFGGWTKIKKKKR